jgi:hypothetical protein
MVEEQLMCSVGIPARPPVARQPLVQVSVPRSVLQHYMCHMPAGEGKAASTAHDARGM